MHEILYSFMKEKLCCILNPIINGVFYPEEGFISPRLLGHDSPTPFRCSFCKTRVCINCWTGGVHWLKEKGGLRKKYPDCMDPWKSSLLEVKEILGES